jgi:hypothetical protein
MRRTVLWEHAAMVTCPGCGALVPDEDGPVHRYLLAAPGCWRMYGGVLARRLAARAAPPDRYPADAYAVQHPGVPGPQSAQSVVAHLAALGLMLEDGVGAGAATRVMGELIATRKGRLGWLEPPASRGDVTVADVAATGDDDLDGAVREWAGSAWAAWGAYQPVVLELARSCWTRS